MLAKVLVTKARHTRGIEVPGAHYYNDERGFSCCMIGLAQLQGRSWMMGGSGSLRAGARPTLLAHPAPMERK